MSWRPRPASPVPAATLAASVLGVGCSGLAAAQEPAAAPPDGAAVFQANCAVCHGAKGTGQPSLAPPLTKYPARYAADAQGRRHLALTVLNGMYGEISVEGAKYDFKMPDFARLDDGTLAAVLNYVVLELAQAPAATPPIRPEDIAAERAGPMDGAEVRKHRAAVLAALGL